MSHREIDQSRYWGITTVIETQPNTQAQPDHFDLVQELAAVLAGPGVAINIGGSWVTSLPDEVLVWNASNDTLNA